MAAWINKFAPEFTALIADGKAKIGTTYRKIKPEYDAAFFRAIGQAERDGIDTEKNQLTWRRENGKFIFEWEAVI